MSTLSPVHTSDNVAKNGDIVATPATLLPIVPSTPATLSPKPATLLPKTQCCLFLRQCRRFWRQCRGSGGDNVAGFGDNVAVFGDNVAVLATLSLVWTGLYVATKHRNRSGVWRYARVWELQTCNHRRREHRKDDGGILSPRKFWKFSLVWSKTERLE